ncbi:unnamed protein product [Triticum turgidum subsp. durum]|uniref:Patatin n=1 Tax=Triticum turgidum subsp. durum TaxID=4567 RepID=A0A9R0WRP4_TRITD|nr:unnamed protein product [Triticum turgidum subsp. durum]
MEAMASPIPMDVDKLSYEIFALLESKFLFGAGGAGCLSGPGTPFRGANDGRVRVLAVDGCGAGAGDALLAAAALARLEAGLRQRAGDPDARVADFFDVAAGAGAGGVLAAMLFLKGVRSVDGRTAIAAASGAVAAMGNPASAAITHVLHNKQEFPLAVSMDDILVLSIGTGASSSAASCGNGWSTPMPTRSPSRDELARVTAQGVADMVDEAVAMAFGHASDSNYVRLQASNALNSPHTQTAGAAAGAMLSQRNVESVLFRGRRLSDRTNAEKVDALAAELVKEQERRMGSPLPNVVIKQVASPRLSSATTASSVTATVRTASTMPSPASWDSRQ